MLITRRLVKISLCILNKWNIIQLLKTIDGKYPVYIKIFWKKQLQNNNVWGHPICLKTSADNIFLWLHRKAVVSGELKWVVDIRVRTLHFSLFPSVLFDFLTLKLYFFMIKQKKKLPRYYINSSSSTNITLWIIDLLCVCVG